jgi:hypothetical protein
MSSQHRYSQITQTGLPWIWPSLDMDLGYSPIGASVRTLNHFGSFLLRVNIIPRIRTALQFFQVCIHGPFDLYQIFHQGCCLISQLITGIEFLSIINHHQSERKPTLSGQHIETRLFAVELCLHPR